MTAGPLHGPPTFAEWLRTLTVEVLADEPAWTVEALADEPAWTVEVAADAAPAAGFYAAAG